MTMFAIDAAGPARANLRIPRWAFVALITRRIQSRAEPRPRMSLASPAELEARVRARLPRELALRAAA